MRYIFIFIFFTLFLNSCKNDNPDNKYITDNSATVKAPENISYTVIAEYPHNINSYTQGLIWYNGNFLEGTGIEGESKLMKVDLKTGNAIGNKIELAPDVFGEGITVLNGKIYQLSWQNHKVFVYDEKTFKKLKEFYWPHEGWGITTNGRDLMVSTGGSNIYIVKPETFDIVKSLVVKDNNGPVGNLNELEYIDGYIYSNVYLTDYIVKIDTADGIIKGKMDFSDLLEKSGKQVHKEQGLVLNGIAYDSTKKVMYITGKKWPSLYGIKLN